ncbi:MAG: hypothetical protein ACI8SZ_002584 [Colwellia sp.]
MILSMNQSIFNAVNLLKNGISWSWRFNQLNTLENS